MCVQQPLRPQLCSRLNLSTNAAPVPNALTMHNEAEPAYTLEQPVNIYSKECLAGIIVLEPTVCRCSYRAVSKEDASSSSTVHRLTSRCKMPSP